MDTKPMSQVLKDATEVTSLSATDKMLVVGTNGGIKKINNNLGRRIECANAQQGSWFRIGRTAISMPSHVLLSLISQWWASTPQTILLSACMSAGDYNANKTYGTISVLSSTSIRNCFTKARFLVPNTSRVNEISYLDVYLDVNNPTFTISIIDALNFTVEITANATIPEGYEAKEFSLSGGG